MAVGSCKQLCCCLWSAGAAAMAKQLLHSHEEKRGVLSSCAVLWRAGAGVRGEFDVGVQKEGSGGGEGS